jgi:hypothetical protein
MQEVSSDIKDLWLVSKGRNTPMTDKPLDFSQSIRLPVEDWEPAFNR